MGQIQNVAGGGAQERVEKGQLSILCFWGANSSFGICFSMDAWAALPPFIQHCIFISWMQNPWGIKHSIFPFACFIWLATLFLFRLIYTLSFFSCSFLFPYFYLCLSCKKLSLSVLESLTGYSCLEALESWLKDLNARGRFADSCISLRIDQWTDFSMYRIFFKIFFFFLKRGVTQTSACKEAF